MLNPTLLRFKSSAAATVDAAAAVGDCAQRLGIAHRPAARVVSRRRLLAGLGVGLGLPVAQISAVARAGEPRQWPVELQVGRFKIHADFDVSSLADLPRELSSLSLDVSTVLEVETSSRAVHVVLFASASEYRRYMQNYFPRLPHRRALFIQDRGPGMLFAHWHTDIASDLRHEVTHALLNDASSPLPLWLDEGLAKYFEAERNRRFDGHVYLEEVSQRARRGIVPSLPLLEAVDQLSDFPEPHYRDSWAWGHFLIHRSTATRGLLRQTLARHRSGAETLPLSRQLALLGSDVSSEFLAHFRMFA